MNLPESWKRVPVSKVAKLVSGGTPTRTNSRYFGGGIPWATPADATAATDLYLRKTAETVTKAGIRASSIEELPAGSVLMTARATVGVVVIASELTTTSQDFINFLPNPDLIDNKYLALLGLLGVTTLYTILGERMKVRITFEMCSKYST